MWFGSTRSAELMTEPCLRLPLHIRNRLHRLLPGQRVLDAYPLHESLAIDILFSSTLVSDEGLALVAALQEKQRVTDSTLAINHTQEDSMHLCGMAPAPSDQPAVSLAKHRCD
jgi:hypothetical protein